MSTNFEQFKRAIAAQFQNLTLTGALYQTTTSKDELWTAYLASFPAGTNPVFKKRTEHDCSSCRQFIKALGGVVAIKDGAMVTIWDIQIGGFYQVVVDAMAALVRSHPIYNLFLHYERSVGTAVSHALLEDKSVETFTHFYVNLPTTAVARKDAIGPMLSGFASTHDVMLRGLRELTLDSINTVLDLIDQNSLYRGEEHAFALEEFRKLKVQFHQIEGAAARDLFVWSKINGTPSVTRLRNTSIGTLLIDLSEGMEMETAVKKFETMVAPLNYKRPKALITKSMVQSAQKKVDELGYTSALERRYATIDDITVNNILFADQEARKEMKDKNVFEDIASGVVTPVRNLDKVEEIGIGDFIAKILPKSRSIEVMLDNKHTPNLVSLIAPVDPTAKGMFKWPNNFSWSYAGDAADSIKERVKRAGGSVTGDFRASLSWFNYDDLDLHLVEPSGFEIYYISKRSPSTGGTLDVDMNAGAGHTRSAVENITYPDRRRMQQGAYRLAVVNFQRREVVDVGFEVEMEFDGVVHSFSHPHQAPDRVLVCAFDYTHKGGIQIKSGLPSSQVSKEVWGIKTQTFHKVRTVMLSPNHWDGRAVGNRHYFFILDGCRNEGKARGFFNEFLSEELAPHRKVLEVVGAKMKTEESDRQLSGLGFSSTQRNSVLCRVTGSFNRVIKILF